MWAEMIIKVILRGKEVAQKKKMTCRERGRDNSTFFPLGTLRSSLMI